MAARLASQIVATIPNRVGLLADVAEAVRGAGVNVTAVSAYAREGEGKFLMVTSDNAKASEALGRLNAEVREKTVVVAELQDRPGALEEAARRIAEAGIEIEYAYGTAGGGTAAIVFKTADDEKVAGML